jgi:hypothetical protein
MTSTLASTDPRTRQFLMAMCARAQSQGVAQRTQQAPLQASLAYANLNRQAVLDLLQN